MCLHFLGEGEEGLDSLGGLCHVEALGADVDVETAEPRVGLRVF